MRTKLYFSFILLPCMLLLAGCSKEDPPEVIEPDYGTLTAIVNGEHTEYYVREPFLYNANQKYYGLRAYGNGLLVIRVPDSIAKPGSYTLEDGVRASVTHGSGYETITCPAVDLQMNLSLFTENRAKGTFEFYAVRYFVIDGDTLPLCENHFANGVFDINRSE